MGLAYEEYIASREWLARRGRYFATHSRACRACRTNVGVQLHHLSYDLIGREPDDDLMPLCQRCHRYVHALHRLKGGSLREATFRGVGRLTGVPAQQIRKKRKKRKKGVTSERLEKKGRRSRYVPPPPPEPLHFRVAAPSPHEMVQGIPVVRQTPSAGKRRSARER